MTGAKTNKSRAKKIVSVMCEWVCVCVSWDHCYSICHFILMIASFKPLAIAESKKIINYRICVNKMLRKLICWTRIPFGHLVILAVRTVWTNLLQLKLMKNMHLIDRRKENNKWLTSHKSLTGFFLLLSKSNLTQLPNVDQNSQPFTWYLATNLILLLIIIIDHKFQ